MRFQKKHHGIEIPEEIQPRCRRCGGAMAISIEYIKDECKSFWYCLNDECECETPKDFEQLDVYDWLQEYPVPQHIRDHFLALIGKPLSQRVREELEAEGWECVGGYIWGGGFWGRYPRDDEEYREEWTGYRGECMEYWVKR